MHVGARRSTSWAAIAAMALAVLLPARAASADEGVCAPAATDYTFAVSAGSDLLNVGRKVGLWAAVRACDRMLTPTDGAVQFSVDGDAFVPAGIYWTTREEPWQGGRTLASVPGTHTVVTRWVPNDPSVEPPADYSMTFVASYGGATFGPTHSSFDQVDPRLVLVRGQVQPASRLSASGTVLGGRITANVGGRQVATTSVADDGTFTFPLFAAHGGTQVALAYSGSLDYASASTTYTVTDTRDATSIVRLETSGYRGHLVVSGTFSAPTDHAWPDAQGSVAGAGGQLLVLVDGAQVATVALSSDVWADSAPGFTHPFQTRELPISAGRHTITAAYRGNRDYAPSTATAAVDVDRAVARFGAQGPSVAASVLRSGVKFGSAFSYEVEATDDQLAPLSGATVIIEGRGSASGAVWHRVATGVTANGVARITVRPTATMEYRAAIASDSQVVGTPHWTTGEVTVRRVLSVTKAADPKHKSSRVIVTAKAGPAGRVSLQRYSGGAWRTVATTTMHAATGATGSARFSIVRTAHTQRVRVVVASDATATGATSATVRVAAR